MLKVPADCINPCSHECCPKHPHHTKLSAVRDTKVQCVEIRQSSYMEGRSWRETHRVESGVIKIAHMNGVFIVVTVT